MGLPFVLPTFNMTCDVWRFANPTTNPPDLSPTCQLYVNTRGLLDIEPTVDPFWQPPVWLRVPMGTDLRYKDKVECPPGSGWKYHVRFVERIHAGFANEYLAGILEQTDSPLGTYNSSGGGGGGGGGGSVLTEGGDHVLTEGGDRVLME